VAKTLRAADGRLVRLEAPPHGALALVFTSTECPIAGYYAPTLEALGPEFGADRLTLVGVCVDPDVTRARLAEYAQEYGLGFPLVLDPRGELARGHGVGVTPEAVVVDDAGRVRYQGRIDDQYLGRRQKNAAPATHELRDAIAAVLDGREPAVAHVEAVGCPLPEPPAASVTPTYARHVAPILYENCVSCHRPGQIGPFVLETYEQARKRAADLAQVAEDRLMPPWRAESGFGQAFRHDRSLADDEIATLRSWADAGAPEGDRAETPPRPAFPDGWAMGEPDLVIEMPEPFEVPASGGDIYRCFVIPTDLPGDVYVEGIEYRPGNARVVHHILGYVDTSGEATQLDAAEDGPGYTCFGGPRVERIHADLGGWAPGVEASRLPEGIGRSLPKGAAVVMQVHYHPNGKPERDRSRIGLYFAKSPVKRTFHWAAALNGDFRLEPDRPETWEVRAAWRAPVDVQAYAIAPHMHMLGRDMTMTARLPDGRLIPLIRIDRWDFQWQRQYEFERPIDLPAGSVVEVLAHFDYSRSNPNNAFRDLEEMPVVTWGEATTDEMCIGFLGVVKAGQDLTRPGEVDDLRAILDGEEHAD
jgi:hypothetical protein